jgi:phosphopantothenoylcysteine decarboxylase/phosphopantothenate--cysteine ligase
MLAGKHIVLGVTGSIAAYKIASLASMLMKQHADVTVIMTKNATNFINPITFESLTGNKCLVDTFDRNFEFQVEHVSLARQTEVFLTAPASANVIAKAAHGIADDMLTTTLLACTCPKIVAPAMNTRMYQNPVVQDNLEILKRYGMEVIDPANGYLACGDTGAGKMPDPEELYEYIIKALTPKDMAGRKVLVTAGPTQEKLDPVRYISNHSTGKMGYAIARQAMLRGAEVTLVSGKVNLQPPMGVRMVPVVSAADMAQAVKADAQEQDIIIKAAAVADYRPAVTADEKLKKKDDEMNLVLERTEDILAWLGVHRRPGQFLCGFSMETEHMLENSRAKLEKKKIDMIVANNLKQTGAGFGTDTNVVTLLTKEDTLTLPIMSKEEVADRLLTFIMKKSFYAGEREA